MKRLLIFSLAYHPHIGGAEVAIREITNRSKPEEIAFHLICNRYDSTLPRVERLGNVTVHRIGISFPGVDTRTTHRRVFYFLKILYVPLAALLALRLHQKHRFHGAWAMMSYMVFPLMLMRLVGVRIPYVLTLQEGDPFEHVFGRWYVRLFLPLLRAGFRHATVVQTISAFLANWGKRMGAACPVEVIPNGVDVARFSSKGPDTARRALRERWRASDEVTVLMHTGRIVAKNGLEDVVRALAVLPASVVFVQVGVGPEEESLRSLAAAQGVADRVHFCGFVPHADLPQYLAASDIFIRPSRSEGMGNSFIEAMAAGVPVIATQVGGIADFLFDARRNPTEGATGWAVDPDQPEQIAAAVEDIRMRPDAVRETVARARAMVRARYEWDGIARAMQARVFARLW